MDEIVVEDGKIYQNHKKSFQRQIHQLDILKISEKQRNFSVH